MGGGVPVILICKVCQIRLKLTLQLPKFMVIEVIKIVIITKFISIFGNNNFIFQKDEAIIPTDAANKVEKYNVK